VPLRERQNGNGQASHRAAGGTAGGSAGWLIGALGLAIAGLVGAGGWMYFKSNELRVAADAETLCRLDGALPEVTVVLLDLSSTLSDVQKLDVKNELTRLRDTVPRFGRIEIFAVDDRAPRVLEPILTLCNPGRGDDMNEIYQNPRLALERWERDFASTLTAAIEKLLETPEAATSPIFEAIQAVSLRTFDDPKLDQVASRRLVLVSDLMQNVPGQLRMYNEIPAFAEFQKTPYWLDVKADLDNVDATIFYLQRPSSQRLWQQQIEFWSRYFEAQGASVERVLPLSGAQ
jgi:hypothetical protein